jgi:hypothetical protein
LNCIVQDNATPQRISAAEKVLPNRYGPGCNAPAHLVGYGGGQSGGWEQIGQMQEDRDLLGDDRRAVLQGRHLAERVDCQEGRSRVLALGAVHDGQRMGRAQFVQQGQDAAGPGVGAMEQRDRTFAHRFLRLA